MPTSLPDPLGPPAREDADRPDLGRFAFLASGIAGRGLEVAWSKTGDAHSDGRTIHVSGLDDAAIRRQVVVHAALVRAGSSDPDTLRADVWARIRRRAGVARAYFALEARRALHALEDEVPGLGLDGWWRDPRPPLVGDAAASAEMAIRDRDRVPPAPPEWGAIDLGSRPGGSGASARAKQREPRPSNIDAGEVEPEENGPEAEPDAGGRNPLARLMAHLGSTFQRGSADSRSVHLVAHGSMRQSPSELRRQAHAAVAGHGAGFSLGAGQRVRYPEWDVHAGSYRSEWCSVVPTEVPDALLATTARAVNDPWLRHEFARLGLVRRRHRHDSIGDDFELDAVIQSRLDARTGHRCDENIYIGSALHERDLSVMVLVDISDSVAERTPLDHLVHDDQLQLAGRILDALGSLGVRLAAYGFHSDGRHNVQLVRFKDFDDAPDTLAQRRLASPRPAGFSRLGAAIRHGASRLIHDGGTRWRVLIVCSDGVAYDDGYEAVYGEADTIRALEEARDAGLCCAAITVGADRDAAQRVFAGISSIGDTDATMLRAWLPRLLRAAIKQVPGPVTEAMVSGPPLSVRVRS